MFSNVLVGVDGSANARDAIALAAKLIEPGAKLTLAHVVGGELNPVHAIVPGMVEEEREESRQMLEGERAAVDVAAELVSVVAVKPGAGLHRQAEAQGADLIVVGTSSRGALGRATLGDDTRAALNGAPCAVAIAARGYAATTAPIGSIGVAYNDSPEARAALACARQLADSSGAAIRALEVVAIPTYAFASAAAMSIGDTIDVMISQAEERMDGLAGVDGSAVYGIPGEELAAFSAELDILVVGSRGYGPVRRLVLGSTSDFLERHARCSLLVLARA